MVVATIHPHTIFDSEGLQKTLGLTKTSLRHAKKQGLRCYRRANKDWYRGEDVLEWLQAGANGRDGSDDSDE